MKYLHSAIVIFDVCCSRRATVIATAPMSCLVECVSALETLLMSLPVVDMCSIQRCHCSNWVLFPVSLLLVFCRNRWNTSQFWRSAKILIPVLGCLLNLYIAVSLHFRSQSWFGRVPYAETETMYSVVMLSHFNILRQYGCVFLWTLNLFKQADVVVGKLDVEWLICGSP